MKKIAAILLLAACTSTNKPDADNIAPYPPKNLPALTMIGTDTAVIQGSSLAELKAEEWKGAKNSCITHLYECQYDDQGRVSQIKALDLSEPTFQEFTEEALRAWQFKPGRSGSCFVQTVYEKRRSTRAIVVPKDMADTMVSNLKKNRAATPSEDQSKPAPTKLREVKPEMPKEMALKGQDAYAIIHYDINPDGIPVNFKVIDAEPRDAWEKNVIQALKRWRYATLQSEPNSRRSLTAVVEAQVVDSPRVASPCDTGLKLNRLAKAQEYTTGPFQAPKPSLK